MLTTPLGDIEIYIDNEKVEYAVKEYLEHQRDYVLMSEEDFALKYHMSQMASSTQFLAR